MRAWSSPSLVGECIGETSATGQVSSVHEPRKRRMPYTTHESYFDTVTSDVRPLLESIQTKVETLLPEAERCIGYNMPAFRVDRIFFYFAAFKRHIGIYPPVARDTALINELAPYRGPKGNLSFPLNQELPVELIGRVAVALYREYAKK